MKKFVCMVCGYVHEGDAAPEKCPVCGAPASKFKEQAADMTWAAEHEVGVAQGASEDIIMDLESKLRGRVQGSWYVPGNGKSSSSERAIRRSAFTGRRQLTKRLSMLPSLQSFSARLLQTAPRRTWR